MSVTLHIFVDNESVTLNVKDGRGHHSQEESKHENALSDPQY